jgi:outer membrane protein OmpA-like peptidoglycan-associated protein
MYLWAPKDYREYIQVGLRKRLQQDSVYQLKLSISLAERSRDAVGNLGFLFTDRPLNIPVKTVITNQILDSLTGLRSSLKEVEVAPLHDGSTEWEDVEFHYRAKGFERYLVVGNFRNDSLSVLYTHPHGSKPGAYYYLDGLTLFGVDAGRPQPSYQLDTTYVFEDILFEFDRHEIDRTGQEDVRDMYFYLRERPDYHIYIAGHTDGLGKDDYNQELALKRARRIADELGKMGIASHRIHVEAYGSLRPVAPNETDMGRQLNRRAEFVLRRPRRK